MKKAVDYYEDLESVDEFSLLRLIKQVQSETIDEMFKHCYDEASIQLMASDTQVVAVRSIYSVAEQLKEKL